VLTGEQWGTGERAVCTSYVTHPESLQESGRPTKSPRGKRGFTGRHAKRRPIYRKPGGGEHNSCEETDCSDSRKKFKRALKKREERKRVGRGAGRRKKVKFPYRGIVKVNSPKKGGTGSLCSRRIKWELGDLSRGESPFSGRKPKKGLIS